MMAVMAGRVMVTDGDGDDGMRDVHCAAPRGWEAAAGDTDRDGGPVRSSDVRVGYATLLGH